MMSKDVRRKVEVVPDDCIYMTEKDMKRIGEERVARV